MSLSVSVSVRGRSRSRCRKVQKWSAPATLLKLIKVTNKGVGAGAIIRKKVEHRSHNPRQDVV